MKLLRALRKGILWFFQKTYEMDTLAYRGREWDWMNKKIKVMNEEEAKDALIGVLMNQVIDLSLMSKIELGDDVIKEIKRLQEIINKNKEDE